MSEVLIDDSSLNAIAHSIRRKNGLLRTYKPREMAPAIRAFNDFIPDAHSFTINVQQSPHQTIRLRKYLDADYKEYTNTFTVSEPFYKADIIVEADVGYEAGKPNYVSPITIDRDMVINASPAVYGGGEQQWETYYVDLGYDPPWNSDERPRVYTTPHNGTGGDAQGVDSRYLDVKKIRLLPADVMNNNGSARSGCRLFRLVEEMDIAGVNVSGRVSLEHFMSGCSLLRKTDLSHLDTDACSTFYGMLSDNYQLRSFGDISNWKTSNLLNCSSMFSNDQYLTSIDLSGWETPILKYCSDMFSSLTLCTVIDISNWSTSQIESPFGLPGYLEYLIMDKEEVKFPNKIFGNNSRTKYLVPASMVDLYKEHSNWKSRASQIDSIDNYTITRYGGQVFVTPNN